MIECEHGEPRGSRYCALCRRFGVQGEVHDGPPTPHLAHDLDWEARAKHVIWELASSGHTFTSEDVTDRAGLPDPTGRPNGANNSVGALLNRVAKTYGLRRVDYTKARNPQAHGRLLTVWQGRYRP